MTGFATILPPNGPNCITAIPTGGWGGLRNNRSIQPPSSFHTGGVNGALGDGSVRFISETIETGNLATNPLPYVGNPGAASPFGTWGALGSINGGESVSL